MSVEQGLQDWVDILDAHDERYAGEPRCVFELQPSEMDRLREDLSQAIRVLHFREQQAVGLLALVNRFDAALDRSMKVAAGFRQTAETAMSVAKRATGLNKDDGSTTRPFRPADRPGEETLAEFSRRA